MHIRDFASHADRAACVALQELTWGAGFSEKIPAARFAHPEEIAKAVIWLVADGDYVTGEEININGGAFMQ